MPAEWHSVYKFISKIRKPPKNGLSGQKEELIYAPQKGQICNILYVYEPLNPNQNTSLAHAPDHTKLNVTPKIL